VPPTTIERARPLLSMLLLLGDQGGKLAFEFLRDPAGRAGRF